MKQDLYRLLVLIFKYYWCSQLALGSRKYVTQSFMFSNVTYRFNNIIKQYLKSISYNVTSLRTCLILYWPKIRRIFIHFVSSRKILKIDKSSDCHNLSISHKKKNFSAGSFCKIPSFVRSIRLFIYSEFYIFFQYVLCTPDCFILIYKLWDKFLIFMPFLILITFYIIIFQWNFRLSF